MIALLVLAAVANPYPGVTLVTQPGSAMVIASLCTPGVSVRATKYSERQATPQQWGSAVGVVAAINADFFDFPGWTLVNGRARGAGEDWPADKQFFESRLYWTFGLFGAGLQENAGIVPPGLPWSTEVVGGHNQLIRDGQSLGPLFDGDAVITTAHRRTAVGMSRDRRTLYLYATDHILDGSGVVAELRALAAEAGAPAIDVATNMDGGGSSQLYVAGYGQIITSGRQVNNHLGVYAGGSGPALNCNNIPPRGTLDAAGEGGVLGWAQDLNAMTQAIDVHVYFNGLPGQPQATGVPVRAGTRREDLCMPLGSCEHAFVLPAPLSQCDGQPHDVHVYGIDTEGGANAELEQSPKTFTCSRPVPAGALRHVVDLPSWAAWRFSTFMDVQPVSDAEVAGRQQAADWPAAPELFRVDGTQEVWLVDDGFRRRVPGEAAAAAWHLDLGAVKVVGSTQLPLAPPLPARPVLVKAPGSDAIWVVDGAREAAAPGLRLAAPVSTERPQAPADGDGVIRGGCAAGAGAPLTLLLAAVLRRRRAGSGRPSRSGGR